MLGDSSSAVLGVGGGGGGGNSSDAVTPTFVAAAAAGTSPHDGGESTAATVAAAAAGSNSREENMRGRGEEGDRSFGGKRWPRQETLALLKMRSDMDVAFRDASVKGPLWEEVSRKMAEHGYHRSAKKCKEKFENVYKYHKRIKDGRTGKSEGKTYRFFDQLEALDHHNPPSLLTVQSSSSQPPQAPPSKPPSQLLAIRATPVSVVATTPFSSTNVNHPSYLSIVPSTITSEPNVLPPPINPTSSIINNPPSYNIFQPQAPPPTSTANPIQSSFPADLLSNSPSSSTSSDESIERRQRRKMKWKNFFGRLTKEVIEKQEQMQKRLLEAIEKREHERMVREEAWRMQEMARINREREILAQERSIAAAKDGAVMALLQKITEQQNLGLPLNNINTSPPPPPPLTAQPVPAPTPAPAHPAAQPPPTSVTNMEIVANDNNNYNGENLMTPTSSRWPKVEVQALIKLRTSMDEKYQEYGPKGPLWEEISVAMRRLGYNRNAKRCKEKWENINKYFKKAKENNKKRPQDAKICPYFHQLDALYREKNKLEKINSPPLPSLATTTNHNLTPADNNSIIPTSAPLMVQPEQQWHPQQEENNNNNAELEEEEEEYMDEEKDIEVEDDEGEEEEGGGNYEIVVSKPASVSAVE